MVLVRILTRAALASPTVSPSSWKSLRLAAHHKSLVRDGIVKRSPNFSGIRKRWSGDHYFVDAGNELSANARDDGCAAGVGKTGTDIMILF